ncbi:hypothetical protein DPMN_072137 [Dreissena polymorpha]|uniref:Uncharacterized protein n=1 Tax=Dreissena polymorpha TaxID=45954 RepID=A0A9D3Z8X6_DREPO|nr:hypothetical protein DPMN_072137 [Dreissena polymorpha]
MISTNEELFIQLFFPFIQLESLDLSKTNIATLPKKTFTSNPNLKLLNLSGNNIVHVSLDLNDLNNLEILDLNSNSLLDLDPNFLSQFASITLNASIKFVDSQIIQCSTCEHHGTVKWIVGHRDKVIGYNNITCISMNTKAVAITESVEQNLFEICNKHIYVRNTIIVSILTTFCGVCIGLCLIVGFIRRRRTGLNRRKKQLLIDRIANNELHYAAFILFSSQDDEFVRSCVYAKFEEYMHHEIDCNRE